ncbi:MAG TPA: hypothetical protein VI078_17265 [bacterium]
MVGARSRLKIGLFLGLLGLLFVHQRARLVPRMGLAGEEVPVQLAPLTPRSWWSGQFQESWDRWVSRRLRLRGWLVRLDNQVGMTLFGQPPTNGTLIVLGRDGTLLEKAYVDEYNRPRHLTPEHVAEMAARARRLDELLRGRGSRLIVVLAPGKAEMYPELLPPRLVVPGRQRRRSMYQQVAPALRRSGVALLDVPVILRRERKRDGTPLYAKGGTHWNHYANALLAGRLLALLEREEPGRFVQLAVSGSRTDGTVWATDNDLGELLNLFWPNPWPGPQTHPVFERRQEGGARPRLRFTGDSFALQFLNFMTAERLIEPGESLDYFRRRIRFPGPIVEPLERGSFDAARELAGTDAVVLVMSDCNIGHFGFGFVEAAIAGLERAAPSSQSTSSKP